MAQDKAAAPAVEEPVDKTLVDEAIASMDRLYETLTGSLPAAGDPATHAPIPVERDPGEFVAERFERLVQALGQPPLAVAGASGQEWPPPMVVWESREDTVVCLDLPGVKRADVEVTEDGGVVTVRGERADTFDGHGLQRAERPLGRFRRQILLPRNWRGSAVKAKLADGVLELRVAREGGGSATARKIELS